MSAPEVTAHLPLVLSRQRAAHELDSSIDFVDEAVKRGDLELVELGPRKRGITRRSFLALIERGLGR